MITKAKLLQIYEDTLEQQGRELTRDEFVKISGVSKRTIEVIFGGFSNLKIIFHNERVWPAAKYPHKEPETVLKSPVTTSEGGCSGEAIQGSKTAEFKAEVKTLDELAQHCNIDLVEWEATKFSASVWDGKCSAKGEFKRRVDEKSMDDMLENFILQAEKHAPKTFVYDVPDKSGKLFILNCQDLHLGKGASKSETGWGNYNIPKAKSAYREAISHLMNGVKTENIEKVLLVCGSDQIHIENSAIETTKGTRLEAAGSWYEIFNETCNLMSEVVEELASKFKVEVVCVYGNHARLSEYALGSYIKAFFRNHENVNVNNQPLDRKYFGFHKNLIGFSHSDSVKNADLPLIMFRENQSIISNFKQFTFLIGHTHQDKLVEIKGVRVITCPALCPPDRFHSEHGFVGNNQCGQGLLFADWGLEKIVYSPNVV